VPNSTLSTSAFVKIGNNIRILAIASSFVTETFASFSAVFAARGTVDCANPFTFGEKSAVVAVMLVAKAALASFANESVAGEAIDNASKNTAARRPALPDRRSFFIPHNLPLPFLKLILFSVFFTGKRYPVYIVYDV
jgi:hypothetical protein